MRISLCVLLVASTTLVACGTLRDTALNPTNWFGRNTSERTASENEITNPLIPQGGGLFARSAQREAVYAGLPFEEITDLTVERIPGGAIVRATGRADRQGRYEVQLTPTTEDETPVDGVLTYRLEGVEPSRATAIGGPATREVTAARHITDQELRGVRSIRVEALRNVRTVRR
jgi:hypothetical protein